MSADDFDFDLNTHIATIIVSTLFVLVFLLFFVFCITVSIRNRHKNKLQRQIFNKTPVVVTSATHTAPGGYPVTQIPPPNTTYQTNVYAPPYPQQGYVINTTMQMPMPMPVAQPPHQGMSGYPPMPMPMPQQQMNPPSYDAAVAGYSAGPPQPSYGAGQPQPQVMPYEKQSPYNPSFTAQ